MKYENVFLSASSIKEADGRAAGYGITSFMLMGNAGRALLKYIEEFGASTESVVIMCGRGGNGGNGYALACLMRERGIDVRVVCTASPKNPDSVAYM